MAVTAHYSLDQFLADTRATIKIKGVPSGLAEIRDHLEKLLANPELLTKFTTETGKILPRRVTGVSAKLHRKINNAIKQSRAINLLP